MAARPPSSPGAAGRVSRPASRASRARPRQSWLRGPGDCGDGSCEGGDLAGRRRRWRLRPRRSHLDNQPTPRPSRRKPGGTRGGAAGWGRGQAGRPAQSGLGRLRSPVGSGGKLRQEEVRNPVLKF
ncbi:uncharacterized protein LOC143274175 [Peromyscus maniculatus bairdii]|uniref:uncharacterized protein LOC143274175 n=1 Tax=Peromyscus maniculatus bairdii TaxID=230844 RepID=UPI003FD65523